MKQSILIVIGGALASLMAIPQMAAFFARNVQPSNAALPENDEIRQTYKLTPGTRIEIANIRGSVNIETTSTDVAEIVITRSAENKAALDQDKINIDNQAGRLTIRGEQRERKDGSDNSPGVRHQATLKLPRRADVSLNAISGQVQIGDLDGQLDVNAVGASVKAGSVTGQAQVSAVSGPVTLGNVGKNLVVKNTGGAINVSQANGLVSVSGVSGAVTLGQAGQHVDIKNVGGDIKIAEAVDSLDVSGVNGGLSAGISKLGARGVQINNVSRAIELRFKVEPGAQFSTKNVPGKVSIDLPNVTIEDKSASAMRARIGSGGPPITINGVAGSVHLALDTQTLK
jgi:hypothetical protein